MKNFNVVANNLSSQKADYQNTNCLSPHIKVDFEKKTICIKKHVYRKDDDAWLDLRVETAYLPASSITFESTRLVDNGDFFILLIKALDAYLLKQRGSKSYHIIASDIARTLIKTIEFAWIEGYYNLKDVPAEGWEKLRAKLVVGSWPEALKIEERTIELLKCLKQPISVYFLQRQKNKPKSLKRSFLNILGTNIATLELSCVKHILNQVTDQESTQGHKLEFYSLSTPRGMNFSMLRQALSHMEILEELPLEFRVENLPAENSHKFAIKNKGKTNRTENIEPEIWARILLHSYKWIYEFGPAVVDFLAILSLHLTPFFDDEMQQRCTPGSSASSYRTTLIRKILKDIEETKNLEKLIGKQITNLVRKNNPEGQTSVYAILNQLFSACFVVIASMNARRKDEISSRTVGLHVDSMVPVDEKLGLYQCEFYIEKTIKDYVPHLVNNVSKSAINLLEGIAEIGWYWREFIYPENRKSFGRDRKLFIYPKFVGVKGENPSWFDFNTCADDVSEAFLIDALGVDKDKFRIAPHMFRRGYGILYHYRYEYATMLALTQKYGHIDTASTEHYLNDPVHTPFGKTAAAKWSAPDQVVRRANQERSKILKDAKDGVGEEKIRAYIQDVIAGSRNFSGGFSKLVARFHRRMSHQLDYSSLDRKEQGIRLGDAIVGRGHSPYPYVGSTCMAGSIRKHAACGTVDGIIARENASPVICAGCPYTDSNVVHLRALEEDEKKLASIVDGQSNNLDNVNAKYELQNLRRVIALHKQRLEFCSGKA